MASDDLIVDLLEEILLRLDDAVNLVHASTACASFCRVDLVHASTACTSFCRIASNSCFHHRFRSLHRPPVLELLGHRTGQWIELLPRRATAPREPSTSPSSPRPSMPGRSPTSATRPCPPLPVHLQRHQQVCDLRPLAPRQRRHVHVSPIPIDPVPTQYFEPFLLPVAAAYGKKHDEDDGDDPSSFQLLCINCGVC
ncbi:hypothetical protein U9M48_037402 [Paspalum notatum var. saurae]|uniref:F-box protein n=1 Tax=Paspalum notatum var. saurae TaxID=547442 RepID=A0AAQ3UEX4_PASNO